jgi:hypothetical protein
MALKIDTLQCSVGVAGSETPAAAWCGRSGSFGLAVVDDSSSSAEFSGRLGHERVGHEHTRKPGVTVSPGQDSAQDRSRVILTPDQRVRVFISSTLEELAEERAASRRIWVMAPSMPASRPSSTSRAISATMPDLPVAAHDEASRGEGQGAHGSGFASAGGSDRELQTSPRRAHLPTEPVDHPGPLPDQVIAGRRYYRRRLLAGDAPGR